MYSNEPAVNIRSLLNDTIRALILDSSAIVKPNASALVG
jgi:hypothetical protein